MKKFLVLLVMAVACKSEKTATLYPSETGPIAKKAMVASGHPLATKVGLEVLRNGGNAYDAAIATQFALAVVFPQAGNIGGGGFAVIREANGELSTLDFREKAPLAASRDMYLDAQGRVINKLSTLGHRAAGVPGSVAGMWELHRKYGSKPWNELIQPAIGLAYDGFQLTKRGAAVLNDKQEDFKQVNTYLPWIINEGGWQEGHPVIQRELAATLAFIRDQGREGFYDGIVADQIAKEMLRGGGLITKEDLKLYEPVWRDPIIMNYKDHKVIGMPPPSSGGIALAQLLKGAEMHGLSDLEFHSPKYINLMAELEKRVYADRSAYLGDADFYEVPVDRLISEKYLKERFADVQPDKVTPSSEISAGELQLTESNETTHFSIVDQEGNAVAITTTLNASMGCKVMVKGAGFFLNNEMDDFSSKPGVPNMYGLIGSEANAIEPGKRMLSSMTPTIVEKDGALKMVVGTPGGATIITSVFQTIINVLDQDMTMQMAVNIPRIHHQWLPDSLQVEKNKLPKDLIEDLEEMGHGIKYRSLTGRMDCILVVNDSTLEGGSDYLRGDSYAEGF